MYSFSLMETIILKNCAKIVKNVAMTDNTIIHIENHYNSFYPYFLLTKHYKTSFFCMSSMLAKGVNTHKNL